MHPRPAKPGQEERAFDPDVATRPHVIILVHGIRDFALWQNAIRSTLEQHGFKVEATNYGRLNLFEFLLPIPYFRRRAIAAVWNQIKIVRQNNPDSDLSIIAHSFGTFVVSHLIKENFDIKFHRIIFCGSVVRYNFEFEQLQGRFEQPIINEVGTRDVWPAMAESITWGYGAAGTYGFRRPLVRDRWHNGARHGFYLASSFCDRFWTPYLKHGTIAPGAELAESPLAWVQLLSIVKLKYVIIVLILIALTGEFRSAFRERYLTPEKWFVPAGFLSSEFRIPDRANPPPCDFGGKSEPVPINSSGLANLALLNLATAKASSVIQGVPQRHQIKFLNDGWYNNCRSWVPAIMPSWIELDLGEAFEISLIKFGSEHTSTLADRAATKFSISLRKDSADAWSVVEDRSDKEHPIRLTTEFAFDPQMARFVRIDFQETEYGQSVRVDELEVYGRRKN